jgi:AcrR family transcriptional regulator
MGGRVIPFDAPKSSATKEKILDTAEELFMEHGFEATSLRQLTAAAGVNLAAVHYHFGGKEELFEAVLTRRLDPMNQERVAFDSTRARGGAILVLRKILTAMFIPALKLARDRERGGQNFLRLLAVPTPTRRLSSATSCPISTRSRSPASRLRFVARSRSCRGRADVAAALRDGALSYTLAGTDALKLIAALSPGDADNDELLLRRLAPFLIAGLKAPLPDVSELNEPPELDGERAGGSASR